MFRPSWIKGNAPHEGLVTTNGAPVPADAVSRDEKGRAVWTRTQACNRCGGQGGSEAWRHTGWTCYQCGGSGRGSDIFGRAYTAEEYAKLEARRAKAAATKASKHAAEQAEARAARDSEMAAFEARYPGLYEAACAVTRAAMVDNPDYTGLDDFAHGHEPVICNSSFIWMLADIIGKAPRLSEAQAGVLQRAVEAHRERTAKAEAAKSAQPLGAIGDRVIVQGTVRVIREREISRYPSIISYWHVIEDSVGRSVVYSGSRFFGEPGEPVHFKATLVEIGEYNDRPQYIVNRPKDI